MSVALATRRSFFKAAAGAACLGAVGAATRRLSAAPESDAFDGILAELIRANDAQIPAQLARQEQREGQRWVGAIVNEYGIATAQNTAGFIGSLVSAVSARESKYHNARELATPLRLAAQYMLKAQHEDGSTDYYATNFHSPPDTAFILESICPSCRLLRQNAEPALAEIADDLRRFIVRGANGLVTGGVHTPNHRWVVCAALASAHALFPNPDYVARIERWLAEGIDIDPDGQYTEKSTTVYSPIVDRALITVARVLQKSALFEPVRRNLEMTLYYVHPDGDVVTEASRRQDKYQRGNMARYYYSYRAMALRDGNGRFAAMARQIERTARDKLGGELMAFLTEPDLHRALPAGAPLPTDYAKVFSYSGLARIRRGDASGTILSGNSTVFSFRKGSAALEALRVACAFFGKGQFIADSLEVVDGRYRLRQELKGPYFQPLTAQQIAQGDNVRMAPNGTLASDSRSLRVQSNEQTLVQSVEIAENRGRFEIRISIGGTDGVPVAIELAFRHGGVLHGVEPVEHATDAYLLKTGTGRYVLGSDVIEFGPGRAEHTYVQLRGALPKWDGQSVYLTGQTPFETTLAIA